MTAGCPRNRLRRLEEHPGDRRYLRNDSQRGSKAVAGEPPWWPAHKIASRHPGLYPATTAGVPG